MKKILLHFQFCLLLLQRICGQTHQFRVRSRELCNETSHYYESSHGVCCTKCPPGTFAFQRCNTKNDTQCHPCTSGTYTEKWNYARSCKTCRPCDSVTGLIVQDNCSATHQTICKCPQDFSCLDEDSQGRCQTCSPLLIPSTMEPEDPTQGLSVWIIAVCLTVSVSVGILLLFLVWNKPHPGKEIGHALRYKDIKEPPSSPFDDQLDGTAHKGVGVQAQPLLSPSHPSQPIIIQNGSQTITHDYRVRTQEPASSPELEEESRAQGPFSTDYSYGPPRTGYVILEIYTKQGPIQTAPSSCTPHIAQQEEGTDLKFPIEETQKPGSTTLLMDSSASDHTSNGRCRLTSHF